MRTLTSAMLLMALVVILGASMTGCTVLGARVQPIAFAAHQSHATQHRPFTDDPHNYGENVVGAGVRVTKGPFSLDVTEGARILTGDKEWAGVPKETFDARFTVVF